jgi:isoquinoline 1-oxidoreductase beta subunit
MSKFSRRGLLKGSAAVLAVTTLDIPIILPASGGEAPTALTPYLRVSSDGAITAILPTLEMGQGTHTGQLMILAEELGADITRMTVEMPAQPADAYRVKFGPVARMRSVASQGIRFWHDPLRLAAARARAVLIAAAAARLGVPAAELDTKDGFVIHAASGKKIALGDLVAEAAKLPLPEKPDLRPETARTLTGKPMARIDIPAKTDGSAVFGSDVKVPDMLHGAVRLAPVWRADVESLDANKASAMPGVVAVVKVPRGAVVVARTWWEAKKAADALDITFTKTPFDDWSSAKQSAEMRAGLEAKDAPVVLSKGDPADALAKSSRIVESIYEVPMLAHMCMEPSVCTARVGADRVDLWMPTQDHDIATEEAAAASGLPIDKVFITTPYLGGGFGRKGRGEIVTQAVLASKAVGGKPVKVMWSREDDTKQGAYRPAMVARFKGGLDANGKLIALDVLLSGPQMGREYKHVKFEKAADPLTIASLATHKYAVADQIISHQVVEAPLPLSPWRSVSSSQNAFFLESFIDELAAAAGKDPLEFRIEHLAGQKRHIATLEKVAELSKWNSKPPVGRFRGIAVCESYASTVSEVAEISVEKDKITVHKVWVAIDCGRAINPDSVAAQMQGSVIEGLGAALFNRIIVEKGQTAQSNFNDYPVLRINQVPPEIEIAIVDTGAPLGGVGEPGLPPIAPAVANALFAATGKRAYSLPLSA